MGTRQVSVRLDEDTVATLDDEFVSQEEDDTRSSVVRELIEMILDDRNREYSEYLRHREEVEADLDDIEESVSRMREVLARPEENED